VAMASSTGSGKTLAFLLPLMQRLRQQELISPAVLQSHEACRPRAVVLAPTRDLTSQIGVVAKTISHKFRVRVRTLEAGTQLRVSKAKLLQGADLVIATPDRLLKMHALGLLSLGATRAVVVDEADDMLLRGFERGLTQVLARCPSRSGEPPSPQMVFVSATLGGDVQHAIASRWPDVQTLVTRCAHRAPTSLAHSIRHTAADKLGELRSVLREEMAQGSGGGGGGARPRALVFCRGVQSARAVHHALCEAGLPAGGCHGRMPEATRRADLAAFVAEPPGSPILVCTDVAARGIDFPHVDVVVNFDFPATSALYLHRGGRAARMGAPGRVLSLVQTNQRRFALSILAAVERRTELHTVRKGDLREATAPISAASPDGARATMSSAADRQRRPRRDSRRSKAWRLIHAG